MEENQEEKHHPDAGGTQKDPNTEVCSHTFMRMQGDNLLSTTSSP